MGPVASFSERRLFERLVARDLPALAEMYDEFSSVVFGIALRVTSDRQAAEDITQMVFFDLWSRPTRFDPDRGSLRPWLITVAHHQGVDWVRREQASRRRDREESYRWPDSAPDMEELVGAVLTAERVREALSELPLKERTPIRLAYFGGRTYRQVADELQIPEGTIKSRIRSGLRHMADSMHGEVVAQAT
jgi:RNA polymerase sigma-70 factor (ECF subfamily)